MNLSYMIYVYNIIIRQIHINLYNMISQRNDCPVVYKGNQDILAV
jgi:hypothetical protein